MHSASPRSPLRPPPPRWDIAPEFRALIIGAEHRFYGESLPFGNDSYAPEHLGLLSHEQALADYAVLLASLKANLSAPSSPVITFGGSYGGMLAAWFRMKYPSSTAGAIAASAPILQIPGLMDPHAFNAVITQDYRAANPVAPQAIFNVWTTMLALGSTDAGRATIKSAMRMCAIDNMDDVYAAIDYFSSALSYTAMADYSVAARF